MSATSASGAPVYLRDLVDVSREYQSPPRFLNYLVARGADGKFERTRAITLAVDMRQGSQIDDFAVQVDRQLAVVKKLLPEDLILRRTSDQPLQVEENVDLFMKSLYEAIGLVVAVALIGFWEWRTALLLALSIPITLAMTFGLMDLFGVDIQQISIASLIIALGLLVDDPVVAGDAIKHSLAAGWKPRIAAWLGPTKLAAAIMFATVTNIVAYLPFLTLPGDVGTSSTIHPPDRPQLEPGRVADRLDDVRPPSRVGPPPRPQEGGADGSRAPDARLRPLLLWRRRVGDRPSPRRLRPLGARTRPLRLGRPEREASLLPEGPFLSLVRGHLAPGGRAAQRHLASGAGKANELIREVCDEYGKAHGEAGKPREILASITEFDGGGGPRFWFSVSPEQQQLNYAEHSSSR